MSPERLKVLNAALRLRRLKVRERYFRTGFITEYKNAEGVLYVLRELQRKLPNEKRKYRAYRARTLK